MWEIKNAQGYSRDFCLDECIDFRQYYSTMLSFQDPSAIFDPSSKSTNLLHKQSVPDIFS
jgi:hypothetical protein